MAVGGGVGLAVEGNDASCCSTFAPFSDAIGGLPGEWAGGSEKKVVAIGRSYLLATGKNPLPEPMKLPELVATSAGWK